MSLNISDFSLFFTTPLKKVTLEKSSQQPPSQNWDPAKPVLFENLVGSSTPPTDRGHNMALLFIVGEHKSIILNIQFYNSISNYNTPKRKWSRVRVTYISSFILINNDNTPKRKWRRLTCNYVLINNNNTPMCLHQKEKLSWRFNR